MPCTPSDLAAMPQRRRSPAEILDQQNTTRLQDLLPVRRERMAESPFAYYRGTAAVMAADLATTPSTGVEVLSCGDAHLGNFGYFASPERQLLFDLNDFDEVGLAPWEWDLKRLSTSVYLVAQQQGASDEDAWSLAKQTSHTYQQALRRLTDFTALERFYATADTVLPEDAPQDSARKIFARAATKARKRTSEQALRKFTVKDAHGRHRIQDQPPLTRHLDFSGAQEVLGAQWSQYRDSADAAVRYLFDGFQVVDFVLRVVGVGSVGTRCFIVLLEDASGSPLFLQVKEAGPSVLEQYGGITQDWSTRDRDLLSQHGEGFRVVTGQRILQAQSDPFLGWSRAGHHGASADPLGAGDYYWRQFRDMKGSINLEELSVPELAPTARVCAALLARAHAQSPRFGEATAWLSEHDHVHRAIADFSQDYARLVVRDFREMASAPKSL